MDRLQRCSLINSGCWGLACAVSVCCSKSSRFVAVILESEAGIGTAPGSERSYVMLPDNQLAVTISAFSPSLHFLFRERGQNLELHLTFFTNKQTYITQMRKATQGLLDLELS